jgi:hypothetical protein
MLYFKLNENTLQGKAFLAYLKTLPYVEIVQKIDKKTTEKISKDEFLTDFKKSLVEVKSGISKGRTLKDTFNAE